MRRLGRVAARAALVAAAIAATGATSSASAAGNALFDKRWISTKVIRNGEAHDLVDRTHVRLSMVDGRRRDSIEWKAGCNEFFAWLEILPRQLQLGDGGQTLAGCERERLRQDRWLARVFFRDPAWHREGKTLRLRAGDDGIAFRSHDSARLR
jgi:heat shock protein HslJ